MEEWPAELQQQKNIYAIWKRCLNQRVIGLSRAQLSSARSSREGVTKQCESAI